MFRKKQPQPIPYNPTTHKPILKCSICNGEQVAGLKNLQTGKFEEVMFIRDRKDLDTFLAMYGLSEISKEY